jgi:hypothetical protein
LYVNNLQQGDLEILPILLESVLKAVVAEWPGAESTTTRITYGAHLGLKPGDVGRLLSAYVSAERVSADLTPDAFAYNINTSGDRSNLEKARVVFAKSLMVNDGVYVEFFVEYGYPLSPSASIASAQKTIWHALEQFGFSRQGESQATNEVRG